MNARIYRIHVVWCPHAVTSISILSAVETVETWQDMMMRYYESCFLQASTVGSYSGWFPCSSWSACRTAVEEMSGSSGPTIKYPVSQRSFRMFQDLFHNNKHCTFLPSLHWLHCAGKSPLLNLQHLINQPVLCPGARHVFWHHQSPGIFQKSTIIMSFQISQLWPASFSEQY